jgi:hypothetical protein
MVPQLRAHLERASLCGQPIFEEDDHDFLHRAIPARPPPTRTVPTGGERAGDPTGAASIDKVRDILFGNQVREFERRFARLEETDHQGNERPER